MCHVPCRSRESSFFYLGNHLEELFYMFIFCRERECLKIGYRTICAIFKGSDPKIILKFRVGKWVFISMYWMYMPKSPPDVDQLWFIYGLWAFLGIKALWNPNQLERARDLINLIGIFPLTSSWLESCKPRIGYNSIQVYWKMWLLFDG